MISGINNNSVFAEKNKSMLMIEELESRLLLSAEIGIFLDGAEVDNDPGGVDKINFGVVGLNVANPIKTFVVRNLGDENLAVGAPNDVAGFSLVDNIFPTTIVPTAGFNEDSFIVKMGTSAAGQWEGVLSFSTNDPNLPIFSFGVQGVVNDAPIVSAGGDQAATEGSEVSFSGSFTDNVSNGYSYLWNFGDGATSTALNAKHVYSDNGDYTATLTVTDSYGVANQDSAVISISNVAPVVDVGGDIDIIIGESIAAIGVVTDPGINDVHSYLWDFGDGTIATTLAASHTYQQPGDYIVSLTVTDNDGGVGADTLLAEVQNAVPEVDAGQDQQDDEGQLLSFSGSFSDVGDPGPHTVLWDFGDGTSSGALQADHTYIDNGVYSVSLTVTDSEGQSSVDTVEVTINNIAPTVEAGVGQEIDEGQSITLSGSFTDPGISDTHTVLWEFGDGTTATSLETSHTYATDGIYTAVLTVTDDSGDFTSDSLEVIVKVVEPVVDAGDDLVGNQPDELVFSGSYVDAGTGDGGHSYLWDFGDGTTADTLAATHTYQQSGIYAATLTVTNNEGEAGADSVMVEVRRQLSFSSGSPAKFTDNNDNEVVVMLTGAGAGTVHIIDGAAFIDGVADISSMTQVDSIILTGAGARSTLRILTRSRGSVVTVGAIVADGDLRNIIASTTTVIDSVNIAGSLKIARLGGLSGNSVMATGQEVGGGLVLTVGFVGADVDIDITGNVSRFQTESFDGGTLEADAIGNVNITQGDLGGTIKSRVGNINNVRIKQDVSGTINAAGSINRVIALQGEFTGTLRAAEDIGIVMFGDINAATVSSGGNMNSVVSRHNMIDTLLLGGYDLGSDGMGGTSDDIFNQSGSKINNIRVNLQTGRFDGSTALAGIKPDSYDTESDQWQIWADDENAQVTAEYGEIKQATLGQVLIGDPQAGIYGLFAASEEISAARYTETAASGSPDFQVRGPY